VYLLVYCLLLFLPSNKPKSRLNIYLIVLHLVQFDMARYCPVNSFAGFVRKSIAFFEFLKEAFADKVN
jgi:hypothetical protein